MINIFFVFAFIEMHNSYSFEECQNLTDRGYLYYDENYQVKCQQTTYVNTNSEYPFWGGSGFLDFRNKTGSIFIYSKNFIGTPHRPYAIGYHCHYSIDNDTNRCLVCHQGRGSGGSGRFALIQDLIDVKIQDCSHCSTGHILKQEDDTCFQCEESFYLSYILDYSKCIKCPIEYQSCQEYYNSTDQTGTLSPILCGQNRNISLDCKCLDGYYEQIPKQLDCVDCLRPCLVCESGSNTKCISCQDALMTINSDQLCECPQNYYMTLDNTQCILCDFACGTCAESSSNCVTCLPSSNRFLSQGSCLCKQYYFQIDGQQDCVPCQWSCASCTDSDSCTTCIPDSNREKNFTTNNDDYCHCISGYAEDISTSSCQRIITFQNPFQACKETCLTCTTSTDTCSDCYPEQNRELKNDNCLCKERYYDSKGEPICKQCDQTCLTCDGDNSDNCLSCSLEKFRVLNNKKECQCKLGYGYYEGSESCLLCVGLCLECDHFENCIKCPQGINRILDLNNKCSCDSGFYEDSNKLCQPCHYSCQTCQGNEIDKCLSCSSDQSRQLNEVDGKQQCKCQPGYYEFYKRCIACYYTCLTCVSQFQDGCTSCPQSRKLIDPIQTHSQCLCKSESQIDDGKSLECTNCHYTCSTCDGPGINNCIKCKQNSENPLTTNRSLQFGQCICPNKWFDDQVNENCLRCHSSCETCFDQNQYSCITCSAIDHRVQQSNSCYCEVGYFENETTLICDKCEYKCGTCEKDKTNCLTCFPGSLRSLVQQANQNQYKTCQCPVTAPGDVLGNPYCFTCHFTCKNCSDDGLNQCTVCDEIANRVLITDANGSYCSCNLSYYEIQTPECAACSTYCLGCVDSASNCTSCNPQQFRVLDGNKCICGLRFGTQQLSYYDNLQDPECVACHYSCYTCYGEQYNQCLTCSDSDFRIKQGNECFCKPNYIDNGAGACMTCSPTCQTCGGQNSLCTSCPANSLRTLNAQSFSCDCPEGYFDSGLQLCEKCDATCATCTNQAIICLSCVLGSNRTLNQFTNYCECISGYYDSGNGSCSVCHYSCLQCSGPSANQCTSCPDFIQTKRVYTISSCLCADQYFDDSQNKLCQPCSSTCHTCQGNQNSCTQCVSGQNRILQGQSCSCMASYFESGSSTCAQCNSLCQECQLNSSFCTKCDSSLIRTLISGTCICDPGYFDDGSLMCKQCHFTCLTCTLNQNNCTSCESKNLRYLDSTSCLCLNGTIDQGQALCFNCDQRCLTCSNINTQCLTCDSKLLRILKGQQCNCIDGFFENAINQCEACDSKCLTCDQNSTTCTGCNSIENKIIDQWQCICKSGYFMNSNKDCQPCSNKCLSCTIAPNMCTSCNTDRVLEMDQCNCQIGYFDGGGSQCLPCNYSCLTCSTTASQCMTCDSNSNRTLQSSKCICNQGFYDIGTQKCFPCKQTCLTCITSDTECNSCDTSLNRVLNGSACECKPGYFEDGNQLCQQCDQSCVTCTQSSSQCTSCDISNTFRMDLSVLLNQCPCRNGFYDDGTQICKKCSYQCLNCAGSKDNCTFCFTNPGYFRDNIPPACNCIDGYFDDGIQIMCQQCSPKCLTCQSQADNCLICESQLKRLSSPSCDCKKGYFQDQQQKCQICAVNCLSCSGNSTNCLTCQPDRITKQCICQDGYYEANQFQCQRCSHKCSLCSEDPLNCTKCALDRINPPNCICQDHFYDDFVNLECQECDQYCGKCDFNGCIDCAANRIQNLKTCICPTDSISYTFTPYCSNCHVAVVQGIFSDDLNELIYTFEYDLQFNFLTQVDVQENCQQLIQQQSLQLIEESPQCRIEQKKLIVSLGIGSIILVGDILQFNTEIFKHTQCSTPLSLIINQKLLPPTQLLNPQISVSYPTVPVSPCSSIEIFISEQKVNGQRNRKLKWSSPLQIPAIDIANQYQFLTLAIDQGQVPENQNIEIIIAFTNFLGQSDSTIVEFQTLSASVPQLSFKNIKKSFIQWAPVKVLVYFANTICTQGVIQQLTNPVQIQFEEIVNSRNPQLANPIKFQQSQFNLEEQEGLISSIIPARSLSVNTNYSILAIFQDLKTNQEVTAQLDFQIERSPLMVQIVGGTKIQNYLKAFQVLIEAKDPDLQTEWNQDPDIVLKVQCVDLQHQNKPCIDQFEKVVPLNKTSNIQFIQARLFKPFTVLLFKVYCQKQDLKATTSAAIILLDAELPTINISHPQGYKIRDVNINEKLRFQIMVDRNQKFSDYLFSYALVYNYETVFLTKVPNQMVEFALWEGFQKFGFINQISVRFKAHNINYLMPQIASITLTVNMPPVNSIPSIQPQTGNALFTQFTMRITNSKDKDLPLQYRYAYYESQQLYQKDILSGRQENLIILQDFTPVQTFKTLLESGNLTILLTVSDSSGSQVNFTQQVFSQSFYKQWQIKNESNDTTSKCKQMVTELQITQGDTQYLIIVSQELIKLLQNKVSQDCQKAIYQQLERLQQILFELLLKSSNTILKSRISNTLSKIYEINKGKVSRQIQSEQNSQFCLNTYNNQLQIIQLSQIQFEQSDNEWVINNISQINQQIQKAIETNKNLIKDLDTTYDLGDDQTVRRYLIEFMSSLQSNIQLRISYIRILGSLFSTVYDQQIAISMIIDQLMDSFRSNLILDSEGIKVSSSGLGLQVYKIGQQKFQNFIIQKQYDFEETDLSNFIINRYIQLVKYKSNKYFYTENFKNTFGNGSFLLYRKETNRTIYEKSIIPYFESIMLDPKIFVDNINEVTQVEQLHQGKLAFNMGVVSNSCNHSQSNDSTIHYNFICSSFIDQQWVHESCQIELFTNQQNQITIKCYCDKVKPISLMIMKTSNKTKQIAVSQKPIINIEEHLNIIIEKNVTIYGITLIFISLLCISQLWKIKKQRINLNQIKEQLSSRRESEPIGLTQKPRMSRQLYKDNFKYLHEISRLVQAKYVHLSFTARFVLAQTNLNVLLTSIHLFDVLFNNYILSMVISVLVQLIFQITVKVLEGFFNGPKILNIFGYFFIISINIGLIAINLILNKIQQEHFIQIVQIAISLIIIYGPIEIILQYYKLSFAFTVSEELRLDPFNPVINFIYYFLQDEIVISLVHGATLY